MNTHSSPDNVARIILLLYGLLQGDRPFWVFVAVKPSQYKSFTEKQKVGEVDLYHFEAFGEVIVAGEGKSPPQEIILKVAELYQTDPAKLMQPTPESEIAAKAAKLQENEEK